MEEQNKDLLLDLIPSIHILRAQVHKERQETDSSERTANGMDVSDNNADSLDVDEECKLVMEKLFQLEYHLENYDELQIIKMLKNAVAEHTNMDDMGEDRSQIDGVAGISGIKNVINKKKQGLEPIRSTVTNVLKYCTDRATRDDLLVTTIPDSLKANKKQRSSNYLSSFNFDDLPMFEPLQVTLQLMKSDEDLALKKLLALDTGELIEHPQWHELLQLLSDSLTKCDDELRTCASNTNKKLLERHIMLINVHVKFIDSLSGQQSIDVVINLLKYFLYKWVLVSAKTEMTTAHDFVVDILPEDVQTDQIIETEFIAFLFILNSCHKEIGQCSHGSMEVVLSTLFILLAKGKLDVIVSKASTESDGISRSLSLLSLVCLKKSSDICQFEFLKQIKPIVVVSHAIHSCFLPVICKNMCELLLCEKNSSNSKYAFNCIMLFSTIILNICHPYFSSDDEILNFLIRTKTYEPQWNGQVNGSQDRIVAHESSAGTVKLETIPDLNKLFLQLSGTVSLCPILERKVHYSIENEAISFPVFMQTLSNELVSIINNADTNTVGTHLTWVLNNIELILSYASHSNAMHNQTLVLNKMWSLTEYLLQLKFDFCGFDILLMFTQKYSHIVSNFVSASHSLNLDNANSVRHDRLQSSSTVLISLSKYVIDSLDFDMSSSDTKTTFPGSVNSLYHYQYAALVANLFLVWTTYITFLRNELFYSNNAAIHEVLGNGMIQKSLHLVVRFCIDFINAIKMESIHQHADEMKETVSNNTVAAALEFLAVLSKDSVLINMLSHSDIKDIFEILVVSISRRLNLDECCDSNAFPFDTSTCMTSILTLTNSLGVTAGNEAAVKCNLIPFINKTVQNILIWEDSQSWYNCTVSINLVMEFLCGLAFTRQYHILFSIMSQAWESLGEFCNEHNVTDLALLLGLGKDKLQWIESETFCSIFLRVCHIALFDANFCIQIKANKIASVDFDVNSGQEESGLDQYNLFWMIASSRIESLASPSMIWRPFLIPFEEEDIQNILNSFNISLSRHLRCSEDKNIQHMASSDTKELNIFTTVDLPELFSLFNDCLSHITNEGNAGEQIVMAVDDLDSSNSMKDSLVGVAVDIISEYCTYNEIIRSGRDLGCQDIERSLRPAENIGNISHDLEINWFLVACVLLGVPTEDTGVLQAITDNLNLQNIPFFDVFNALHVTRESKFPCAFFSKIRFLSLILLSKYKNGKVLGILSDAGVSHEHVVDFIIQNWFFTFLSAEDVILVTAATIQSGCTDASAIVCAIVINLSEEIVRNGARGGSESIIRAMCSSEAIKYSVKKMHNLLHLLIKLL